MRKIIAIGGGAIGKAGHAKDVLQIDREAIRLTGKKHPKLLFIPTASLDDERYVKAAAIHFEKRLGCTVQNLLLYRDKPSKKEIKKKIFSSDIIYVGGGNTYRMMCFWRKMGIDKLLRMAAAKGIVLTGLSAGAICWFRQGNSDSRLYSSKSKKLIKVSGFNLNPTLVWPHYDSEKRRKPALKKMMKKMSGIALALQDCTALEVVEDRCRILSTRKQSNAYKVYWKHGKFYHVKLKRDRFLSIEELVRK